MISRACKVEQLQRQRPEPQQPGRMAPQLREHEPPERVAAGDGAVEIEDGDGARAARRARRGQAARLAPARLRST